MAGRLRGKRVACLVTDGFEYAELVQPKEAIEAEGAAVDVISIHEGDIVGETRGEHAGTVSVDMLAGRAEAARYDGLLLPGGVKNPDRLRIDGDALAFITHFVMNGQPIAAICHGPWTLINAGGVRGRELTSWPSLKLDLENAGATWIDQEVVKDGNLLTSRKPEDLPVFVHAAITLFGGGERTPAANLQQRPPASGSVGVPGYYETNA